MNKLLQSLLIGAALTTLAAAPVVAEAAPAAKPAATAPAMPKPTKSGQIEANGVTYYYEVRGSGPPMLLLHGGLGSIDMFAPVMPKLIAHHTVIAVDLHGHGRTALGDRPFTLEGQGADGDHQQHADDRHPRLPVRRHPHRASLHAASGPSGTTMTRSRSGSRTGNGRLSTRAS